MARVNEGSYRFICPLHTSRIHRTCLYSQPQSIPRWVTTTPHGHSALLFIRFFIMYDFTRFSFVLTSFLLYCTHVRLSYVLNPYLLTYVLCYKAGRQSSLDKRPSVTSVAAVSDTDKQGLSIASWPRCVDDTWNFITTDVATLNLISNDDSMRPRWSTRYGQCDDINSPGLDVCQVSDSTVECLTLQLWILIAQ